MAAPALPPGGGRPLTQGFPCSSAFGRFRLAGYGLLPGGPSPPDPHAGGFRVCGGFASARVAVSRGFWGRWGGCGAGGWGAAGGCGRVGFASWGGGWGGLALVMGAAPRRGWGGAFWNRWGVVWYGLCHRLSGGLAGSRFARGLELALAWMRGHRIGETRDGPNRVRAGWWRRRTLAGRSGVAGRQGSLPAGEVGDRPGQDGAEGRREAAGPGQHHVRDRRVHRLSCPCAAVLRARLWSDGARHLELGGIFDRGRPRARADRDCRADCPGQDA